MEMYLAGVPVYTIMIIGRWLSDAFLRYILKQVEQFLCHVAKQMLTFKSFRTIPDITPFIVSIKDPRQQNHRDNVKARQNFGATVGPSTFLFPFHLIGQQCRIMKETSYS